MLNDSKPLTESRCTYYADYAAVINTRSVSRPDSTIPTKTSWEIRVHKPTHFYLLGIWVFQEI